MKCLLVILMFSFSSFAAIGPIQVRESALKYHPSVQAAIDRLTAGEEAITGARGAFDTKIESNYRRQTKHDWNTTVSRTQIEKPLRFANSKIYAGSEQASNPDGLLSPIYNTGNPSIQHGNYTLLGAKVSLWRNLFIDKDRAGLKNAKVDAKIAQGQKQLTMLDIGRLGQLAYWEWVTAKKVENAYSELLENGETRNEYLNARSKKGDIAQILVTENEQYIASRKGSYQAAKERSVRAEYSLSLFLRDQNGEPIVPSAEETYEDYPADLSKLMSGLDLGSNIDEIIKRRPDMKNLSLVVEKNDVEVELAKQDLKPQIDVAGEYFQRTHEHARGMPRDYLMVLAQISIPIERNLGNGNIASARARKMASEKELSYGREYFKAEVLTLRQALNLQLEQVIQSEIEFNKSKELVTSETYKFKTGGGNLFLVNLREETKARAEASFHESRLQFMNTLLTYQAMVSAGE